MSVEKQLWEIRLGVIASESEARAVIDQIERLLCPDPDHTPPCPIPWSVSIAAGEDLAAEAREAYEDVVEQYRIESGAS
ncbi:hypothetical protein ACFWPK_21900 [Nocardia sp. NPDC058519]|uniref:hypothetical protein n=1 Tax=Nocardia sp. NPDC058519 TaxID=3346535 RepID=UPI00366903AC